MAREFESALVQCGHDSLDSHLLLDMIMNGANLTVSAGTAESGEPSRNHEPARLNPEAVKQLLLKEIRENRYFGPCAAPPFWNLRTSPLSLEPKPGANPPWRLIHDLTSSGLNDRMQRIHVEMDSADEAAIAIAQHGAENCLLAKVDIKAAYRQIRVAPVSAHLQGASVDGEFYADRCLAFGGEGQPGIVVCGHVGHQTHNVV